MKQQTPMPLAFQPETGYLNWLGDQLGLIQFPLKPMENESLIVKKKESRPVIS